MKSVLALLAIILVQINTYAQDTYSINGTVKNVKGEALPAATVFIAGSEKAMATDAGGNFKFNTLIPGTYQLVVNMLGYAPSKTNIILKDASKVVDIVLNEKEIVLNEVTIGSKSQRERYIKLFIKAFMGQSPNAEYCKILNPELLEFSTNKTVLKATTSDFLIIENNALGYRIKYLLKAFSYDPGRDITFYDGDYSFEQMTGTSGQLKKWTENRRKAYKVSLMHYLRSLYAGTSRQEGFLIYKLLVAVPPMFYESIPLPPEQVIDRSEKNLISLKTDKPLYILYDKKVAAKSDPGYVSQLPLMFLGEYGSIFGTDARIDSRGSFTDYQKLLIKGFWALRRVADQLPWEYMPE